MDLFLFTTDHDLATAVGDVVDGFVVDWERADKWTRQSGYDTQIGTDTVDDLVRLRSATRLPVIVRINNARGIREREVELAIARGADEILLPMVRTCSEVDEVLSHCSGRAGVGVMLETDEALDRAAALDALPVTRFFVGMNDLAIGRGSRITFTPMVDGTIARVRAQVTRPLGFAGLTDPDRGDPIPCRALLAQMVRLGCDFTFLRRSFLRDVRDRNPRELIASMRRAVAEAQSQDAGSLEPMSAEFREFVRSMDSRALP